MKLVTPSEIEATNEKLQQIEMKKMAYQQMLADELVRERIRTGTQVVQFQLIQESIEQDRKDTTPEAEIKKIDEAIAYYKKEEQKKYKLLKELSQVLNNQTVVDRIVKVLEETE